MRSRFTKIPTSNTNTINKIYRYFDEEEYAEQFLAGNFRLSTLNKCRAYENKMQGDKDEGKIIYYSGYVGGTDKDTNIIEIGKRLGFPTRPNDGKSIVNMSRNKRETVIDDAFLLCTSTIFSPNQFENDFGKYCVEIIDPSFFLKKVSEAINDEVTIESGHAGKVDYKDRHYEGLEQAPNGDPAFIKPQRYHWQNEYRFIWYPTESRQLSYLDVTCTKIRGLLTRLS
jgi:hypothetical protein